MNKKYCVDYKIGSFDWHGSWFDTKEEISKRLGSY